MEKRLEYALEFLMYSYFGATFKHCDGELSEIEKCAAAKAYNDATMRAALVTKDKTLEDKNGYQDAIRFAVKDTLVAEIVKMFSSENVLEHDWHEKICKKLVESFNKEYSDWFKCSWSDQDCDAAFTYGNAQKFVNMYVKYLYILTVLAAQYEKNEVAEKWTEKYKWMFDRTSEFQVPIDRYILSCIGDKETAWSKIQDETEYENLRKKIDFGFDDENDKCIEKAQAASRKDQDKRREKNEKILKSV